MSDDKPNYYEILTGKSRQNITSDDVDLDVAFDFDAFVDGYIDAILWIDCLPASKMCGNCGGKGYVETIESGARCTECFGTGYEKAEERGGCEHLDVFDETRQAIITQGQLREFVEANLDDLLQYVEACNSGVRVPYDSSQGSPESFAGHDFYLTRAGHGAGFWDRDLGELGDRLTKAAQAAGSVDDHMLYDNGDGEAVV